MFFRRVPPREPTFDERIENLKKMGFDINFATSGRVQPHRDGITAIIDERPGQRPHVTRAGLSIANEIASLVNGGYQVFWKTSKGNLIPAQASQLQALHRFEEDLKEALGLPSLYNEGLGTTSDLHLYDRVEHRDRGDAHKPWEHR